MLILDLDVVEEAAQHLILYLQYSPTVSGKIFISIGAVISSTVVKALSIITASKMPITNTFGSRS